VKCHWPLSPLFVDVFFFCSLDTQSRLEKAPLGARDHPAPIDPFPPQRPPLSTCTPSPVHTSWTSVFLSHLPDNTTNYYHHHHHHHHRTRITPCPLHMRLQQRPHNTTTTTRYLQLRPLRPTNTRQSFYSTSSSASVRGALRISI
jgi:hypothetical protein